MQLEGITFYGTPWQPEYHQWAFNLPEHERRLVWSAIPSQVNVLITHVPAAGTVI